MSEPPVNAEREGGRADGPCVVQPWRRVVVETPYAGERGRNLRYLRACLRDCLRNGEAPFASHGLYTQNGVLDDDVPEERELGLRAGRLYRSVVEATVVYTDLGISPGMVKAIEDASACLRTVLYRKLPGWAETTMALSGVSDELFVARRLGGARSSTAAIEVGLQLVAEGYDPALVSRDLHRVLYGNDLLREVYP